MPQQPLIYPTRASYIIAGCFLGILLFRLDLTFKLNLANILNKGC